MTPLKDSRLDAMAADICARVTYLLRDYLCPRVLVIAHPETMDIGVTLGDDGKESMAEYLTSEERDLRLVVDPKSFSALVGQMLNDLIVSKGPCHGNGMRLVSCPDSVGTFYVSHHRVGPRMRIVGVAIMKGTLSFLASAPE